MNEIKLLDKSTIDKIAAGEVVERPASAVKELIENSIDAGADFVSVEIIDGGTKLIRVTDNGTGIPKDQVRAAVLPHATSKIRNADDLRFVRSLGFRGEALSSIGAVCDLEICTKTKDELTGTILKISGGTETDFCDAGLPDGTTIVVRNLFSYVPARLKFLKSYTREASQVEDVLEKTALSHPDVAIKFVNNGKIKINTSGSGKLSDVIYSIFGKEAAAGLLEVDGTYGLIHVSGYAGRPELSRRNRNYELYFVNGRYVRSEIIDKAIESVYDGYQMKGTFPFTVLNIELEPELTDVNVHPSKLEVRFYDNNEVFDGVGAILKKTVRERENIPDVRHFPGEKTETAFAPSKETAKANRSNTAEPFEASRRAGYVSAGENNVYFNDNGTYKPSSGHSKRPDDRVLAGSEEIFSYLEDGEAKKSASFEQETLFDDRFISEPARKSHRVIGEVFDTYWLIEYGSDLFIMDQHAAHEKVLYEKFMNSIKDNKHDSQLIMPGITITLSSNEEEAYLRFKEQFKQLGFEIRHCGGKDYMITAVPADLYSLNDKDLFCSFIDELASVSDNISSQMLQGTVATAACKAAVKGNNRLSFEEADRLIDDLLKLDNPYNCPHGRPTIIKISKYELEKRFNRIV